MSCDLILGMLNPVIIFGEKILHACRQALSAEMRRVVREAERCARGAAPSESEHAGWGDLSRWNGAASSHCYRPAR
ncbi:hypothethical protein (plasmid) [Ralstonia solanacearum CMR15]|nr:hypothethical protein [Ralstonia solanacearum CMR15]